MILHKIISDRPQDMVDVEKIIEIQGESLDREYLDERVEELADLLENQEIIERYKKACR